MNDCISRQALMKKFSDFVRASNSRDFAQTPTWNDAVSLVRSMPSAQTEPHYCRKCEWSRCHINVDKYGKSETYWWCINWVAETDEEGYCHEWKRKTDG